MTETFDNVVERKKQLNITPRKLLRTKRFHPGTKLARQILKEHGRNLDKCENCGSSYRISIHHKDGNPYNNQIENLQVFCSLCHSHAHGMNFEVPEAFVIEEFVSIMEDALIPIVDMIDESLMTVELTEEEIKGLKLEVESDKYGIMVRKEKKKFLMRHLDSIFKGYHCCHCIFFRAFKGRCDYWQTAKSELSCICEKFEYRGDLSINDK